MTRSIKMWQSVAPGSNRLLYLPYLMGERTPHLDPDCRGVFFGLSAIHTRKHLLRAVMEGVAYSLCDCNEILKEMGDPGRLYESLRRRWKKPGMASDVSRSVQLFCGTCSAG